MIRGALVYGAVDRGLDAASEFSEAIVPVLAKSARAAADTTRSICDAAYHSVVAAANAARADFAQSGQDLDTVLKSRFPFYKLNTPARRAEILERVCEKYGDGVVPIIVAPRPYSKMEAPTTTRYVMQPTATVSDFSAMFARRYFKRGDMKCRSHKYIWFQTVSSEGEGGVMLSSPHRLLREVYRSHRNADGFLYLIFDEENCFGG